MSDLMTLLDRNRLFAATGDLGSLTAMPANRVFVITCLDPRVEPAGFLGLGTGDAIVLRNPGGRVTDAAIRDVALISYMGEFMSGPQGAQGPPLEVAVIHHTQCGMGLLAHEDFLAGASTRLDVAPEQLARWSVTDPSRTVHDDVHRLASSPLVTNRITVSGHVLDLATGLVSTIVEPVSGNARAHA